MPSGACSKEPSHQIRGRPDVNPAAGRGLCWLLPARVSERAARASVRKGGGALAAKGSRSKSY